jgi:hypothetical protein
MIRLKVSQHCVKKDGVLSRRVVATFLGFPCLEKEMPKKVPYLSESIHLRGLQ